MSCDCLLYHYVQAATISAHSSSSERSLAAAEQATCTTVSVPRVVNRQVRLKAGTTCDYPPDGSRNADRRAGGRKAEGLSQRGGYNFGRDMGALFATPASSTLLVKLAYWFNP